MAKMRMILIVGVTAFWLGCSIKAPEIAVTGEKTALENQVLGQFQQLDDKNGVIASTRSIDPLPDSVSSNRVFDAVHRQKFRNDELVELKRKHVIGEGNDGFLAIVSTDEHQTDSSLRQTVERLVNAENDDRRLIYAHMLASSGAKSTEMDSTARAHLVRLNHDQSEPGTLIQLPDGKWVEKESR